MGILKKFFPLLSLKIKLKLKGKRRAICFDLASMGELQFLRPIILRYSERHPEDLLLIAHSDTISETFNKTVKNLQSRVIFIDNMALRSMLFPEIDIFITSEQYDYGLDSVYSISIFHGQPSKGLSFTPEIVHRFDAFFLLGPLHRQSFEDFVKEFLGNKYPEHLRLFEIGYPKSDDLLNGCFSAHQILEQLGLNPENKTILYAPAFNEGASLREFGIEIIKLLANEAKYNVIVKLPIDCWQLTSNFYATGGVNWFETISMLETSYPNLRLYTDYIIDPLLACSNILVTCISSVSFEFLALDKPVIFIDTPKYFSGYLRRCFPDKDTVSWANKTTVNGGREFGLVISDIKELPSAVANVLSNPQDFPRQRERLKSYLLYNQGKGTEAAVRKIEELLAANAQTSRPYTMHWLLPSIFSRMSFQMFYNPVKAIVEKILNSHGYTIQRTGSGYIDPKETISAARNAKLSICDYLESKETDKRKVGRRNRIIEQMEKKGLFKSCNTVLEIGPGTGMYLEKVLEKASPKRYEIYETHPGWVNYLRDTFGKNSRCDILICSADGETLHETPDLSCNLVHAHAVFVYIPFLQTCSYIKEAARVLVPGGYLLFDCCLDCNFSQSDLQNWLNGPWRFPVILPEFTLMEFTELQGFKLVDKFKEIYGSSSIDYLLFQKLS